jgi:hypothetical protein
MTLDEFLDVVKRIGVFGIGYLFGMATVVMGTLVGMALHSSGERSVQAGLAHRHGRDEQEPRP